MPRDADARKSAILAAVAEVIVEIGFTAMTVADVARRAGVSTALVHYHFSSKSDLIRAAISVAGEEERSSRETIAARDASAQDRIAEMLIGSLPEGPDDPTWLLWIETWGEIRRLPEVRRLMEDLDRHELESISALIVSGRADGEFACEDPVATAQRLVALRDGLAVQRTLFSATAVEDAARLLRSAMSRNLGLHSDDPF